MANTIDEPVAGILPPEVFDGPNERVIFSTTRTAGTYFMVDAPLEVASR